MIGLAEVNDRRPGLPVGARARALLLAFFVLVGEVAVAALTTSSVRLAGLLAVGVVSTALALADPVRVVALSFPAVYLSMRLGAGGLDLSYADAALGATASIAVLLAPWRAPAFRRMFKIMGLYLGVLALAVIATPTQRAVIEWAHRSSLLIGSLAVGACVASSGRAHLALRTFLAASVVVSLEAVHFTLVNGLKPAYPFTIHKNAAGMLLTCALIVVSVARPETRLPKSVIRVITACLLAGALACQSRTAVAAFAVVLLISSIRLRRGTSILTVLGLAAMGGMAWTTSQGLTEKTPDAKFNSLNTRLNTFDRTLALWRSRPLTGVGLRYWRDTALAAGEPHNLIIAGLGESGIVGVLGLLILNGSVCSVLWRRRDVLGQLALFIVLVQLLDGLGDIYWRAGTGTIAWLFVGLAAGPVANAPGGATTRSSERDPVGLYTH